MLSIMKKSISLVLAVVMLIGCCAMTTFAEPDETPVTVYDSEKFYIKEGSTDNLGLTMATSSNVYTVNPDAEVRFIGSVRTNAGATGSIDVECILPNGSKATEVVEYEVVTPEFYRLAKKIDDIRADDKNNSNSSTFLQYINSDLSLIAYGEVYDKAIGNGKEYRANSFNWKDCDIEFNPHGGVTYTFRSTFNNSVITREVSVTAITREAPYVFVDYDNLSFWGVDRTMSYSLDAQRWSSCQDNMQIQNTMYGKWVYFVYPETSYADRSPITEVYVPERAERPTAQLKLVATYYSVTVTNCWDFDDVEYSLDKIYWYSTTKDSYTFRNLNANTNYTVYARKKAKIGWNLPSDIIQSNIRTSEKTEDGIDIDYSSTNSTATVRGTGLVDSSVSYTTLTGSWSDSTLERFKNIIAGYLDKKLDTDAKLTINHYKDVNEPTDVDTIKFSLPLNPLSKAIKDAGLTIEYNNDFLTMTFDNKYLNSLSSYSLSMTVSKPKSLNSNSSVSWVKKQFDNGRPVYEVDVGYNKPTKPITYTIDYVLGKNETVAGLQVYNVSTSGEKTQVACEYDAISQQLTFRTSLTGYFVVTSSYTTVIPFNDTPSTAWYYQYVEYCYNNGIFNGTSATTFSPTVAINEPMIYTLIARVSGENIEDPGKDARDTEPNRDKWFFPYIYWARKVGLIRDYNIDAEGTMTRAEIATVLYNFLRYMKFDTRTTITNVSDIYDDVDNQDHSVKSALILLYEQNIMEGMGNKKFKPDSELTRAEMATIMYRLDKLLSK